MYVDDVAEACEFFLKKNVKHSYINIGSGQEKTIKDFAKFIMKKLNIKLKIKFDKNKPNGTPRWGTRSGVLRVPDGAATPVGGTLLVALGCQTVQNV